MRLHVAISALTIWLAAYPQAGPLAAGQLAPFSIVGDTVPAPLAGLSGDADRGRRIVMDRRVGNCLICHRIATIDEPFQGTIGPPLGDVGSRLDAAQLRLRLIDQSRINPATIMPPYYRVAGLHDVAPDYRGTPALAAQQIEDVVAYLSTLKE